MLLLPFSLRHLVWRSCLCVLTTRIVSPPLPVCLILRLAVSRASQVMMMSVVKRASMPVTFWLLENFLSSSFKDSARALAEEFG